MKEFTWRMSLAVILSVAIAFAMAMCLSCKPSVEATAAKYQAEQLACVDLAQTLEESRSCRDAVKKRYGRFDGGVADVAP